MIYQSPQNPNSHLTIKERKWPSYPTKWLLEQNLLVGKVLDFGCGPGVDLSFLKNNNFDASGYDPYYVTDYPTDKFDTIICHYVLNVLLPEEQAHVLMAISELLKPSGRAYFTVRRDIKKSGFRTHMKHGSQVYQCNTALPYKSILKAEHCEIYEYQHINQRGSNQLTKCQFCSPSSDSELVTESATAYAIFTKKSSSKKHIFVIPKKHEEDYFELESRVKRACWLMADRVKNILTMRYRPDGYNIAINIGKAAGQATPHVNIEIIPRYLEDR